MSAKTKLRLLVGIHYRFWHAGEVEMKKLLHRAGHSKEVVSLCRGLADHCKECSWKRKCPMPRVKASLSEHFNYRIQTDLFFIFDRTYVVLIDECIRWAMSSFLQNRTKEEWLRVFFRDWVRFFGPPYFLVSDQEGSVVSDLVGHACE